MKDITEKIEEYRSLMYKINPDQKEKLLTASRKLDNLIVEYHRSVTTGRIKDKPRLRPYTKA